MKSILTALIGFVASLSVAGLPFVAVAQPDPLINVTVAFGTGVNTDNATPSPPENHAIHPEEIIIRQGGTVHFVVSGFHHIVVFQRGIRLESLQASGPAPFLNDPNQPVYYNGFNPGPPGPSNPLATPVPAGYSGARNRVESVYFDRPGVYLVICNVLPHLNDGMFAHVRVLP